MDVEINNEIWQVESGGDVVETSFDEMAAWIASGSLLRIDRVRKGDLRWIEAGKVPSLVEFFNAKDADAPADPVITTTNVERLGVSEPPASAGGKSVGVNPTFGTQMNPAAEVCAVHTDAPAAYSCETCLSAFCKACPTGYGSSVKICPFCGAMCRSLAAPVVEKVQRENRINAALEEGFGFADFGRALAFPFRFKASLIMGAVMFMFFSVGQGVAGFGGIFMMFGALICFLMANTLSFGILANTVENFSQGKTEENFMPSFDDFSIWDDVVHPFFLSIGVYLSSFGPFIVVVLVAVFMVVGSVNKEMNAGQSDAARIVNPGLPYAAKAANQSEQVRAMVNRTAEFQKRRVEQVEKGQIEPGQMPDMSGVADPGEQDFEQLNKYIAEQKKAQLESAVGKTPETIAKEREAMFEQIRGKGLLLLLLLAATFLWGILYFPAACAVAGYTRSFMATMNPSVGIDTIRRLGGSYIKVLLMAFVLAVVSGTVGAILGAIFYQFDMPGVGNLPAKALSSLFGFYITVVFSCVLGYALFKNSDKLKLYR
ncbi:MAG: DUF4013 domain-containing protein [Pyrinomonadaceae bacterium]|nr:DUF4013 domain-containing protein [Pyrinomonadaceae bacterium]